MATRHWWVAGLAVLSLLIVWGALVLGSRQTAERLGPDGGSDSTVARGGLAPIDQPPVTDLTLEGIRDAFNAAAGETRLLVMLSPT